MASEAAGYDCEFLLRTLLLSSLRRDDPNDGKPCPLCKENKFTTLRNKGLERALKELAVRCEHKGSGCSWNGELGGLDKHLSGACPFVAVECRYDNCHHETKRKDMSSHEESCGFRPFCCKWCQKYDTWYDDVTHHHWPVCPKYPVSCLQCNATVERQHLPHHVEQDCLLTMVDCEFSSVGCKAHFPRMDLQGHITTDQLLHLTMVNRKLVNENAILSKSLSDLDVRVADQKREVEKLAAEKKELESKMADEVAQLTIKLSNQKRQLDELDRLEKAVEYYVAKHGQLTVLPVKLEVTKRLIIPPPGEIQLVSCDFYSKFGGYKIQIQLYGKSEGYFLLPDIYMRMTNLAGQFDDILQWPFNGTVVIQVESLPEKIYVDFQNVPKLTKVQNVSHQRRHIMVYAKRARLRLRIDSGPGVIDFIASKAVRQDPSLEPRKPMSLGRRNLLCEAERDQSTSEAERDPSTSKTERDPSTSKAERDPSTSEAERDPSTSEAERDPSASETERDPSASEAERDPSAMRQKETLLPGRQREIPVRPRERPCTSEADSDPFTSKSESDPSASEAERDPSTSKAERPLYHKAERDPTTSEAERDPSTSEALPVRQRETPLPVRQRGTPLSVRHLSTSEAERDPPTREAERDTSEAERETLHHEAEGDSSTNEAQRDPSTSERNPSTSEAEQHPTTSEAERDPSTSEAERDSSTCEAWRDPSTSVGKRDPSTSKAERDPSISDAESDTSTTEAEIDPSLHVPVRQIKQRDPSTSEADPSTSEAESDPSTIEAESDPSTSEAEPSKAGPAEAHVQYLTISVLEHYSASCFSELRIVTSVLLEATLFSPNTVHVCNKKEYALVYVNILNRMHNFSRFHGVFDESRSALRGYMHQCSCSAVISCLVN
eukprot:Em0002g1153a